MSQQTNSITLNVRPLVASLRAANLFTLDHLRPWCLRLEYLYDPRYQFVYVMPSKVDRG